tara:strand:+ start:40969 stop:41871 length:903 start_codon:yes stop_codon:yes gene_type:complete
MKKMKNILKHFTLIFAACLVTISCDYDEDNFALLSDPVDPNATYYIQFKDASKSLQTAVDPSDGSNIDISTTVTVGLLGMPRSQDIQVNVAVDPSSTIEPSMYTLSSTSITIPAGSTSGSVDLVTNSDLMPEGEVLELVLNVDAGANTATAGTKLVYELERIKFCLMTLEDYVGTWTGTDSWGYSTQVETTLVGGELYMNGIGFGWFQDWWGEVIITNTPVKVNLNLYGAFEIDQSDQIAPYLTSTYLGAPQTPYYIFGSGKITNTCDQVLEFEYSYDQGGSIYSGTAWGPQFKETLTKS